MRCSFAQNGCNRKRPMERVDGRSFRALRHCGSETRCASILLVSTSASTEYPFHSRDPPIGNRQADRPAAPIHAYLRQQPGHPIRCHGYRKSYVVQLHPQLHVLIYSGHDRETLARRTTSSWKKADVLQRPYYSTIH